MMDENQFIKSQQECAKMLGMTLNEYQEYCKNLKVQATELYSENEKENKTLEVLDSLGIDKSKLKLRKD